MDILPLHTKKARASRLSTHLYDGKQVLLAQILWIILVVIVAMWLIGVIGNIAGNLIHVLLVVGVIILVYNLITNRRQM